MGGFIDGALFGSALGTVLGSAVGSADGTALGADVGHQLQDSGQALPTKGYPLYSLGQYLY